MAENIITIRAPSAFSSSNPKVMDGGRGVRHDAIVFSTSSLAATIKSHRTINYIFMVWLAPVSLVMLHQPTWLQQTNQPTSHHDSKNKASVRVGQRRAENRVNQVGAVYTAFTAALQKCCRGELWRNDRKALLKFVCRSSPSFIYMYIFVAYKSHVAGHSFWCRNVLQFKALHIDSSWTREDQVEITDLSEAQFIRSSSIDHPPPVRCHVSSFTLLFRGRLINHTHSRLCNPRINTQSAFLLGICSGKVWAF